MKTKNALTIDHLVGIPLCWTMNFAARLLGRILRRDHQPPFHPKRILFIKLMGAGSVVQALPSMQGLAEHYPDAEVRMLCFPETRGIASRIPFVRHIYTIEKTSIISLGLTSLRALLQIARWRPDLVLDLEYRSKFSSLLSSMTLALNRGGLFDVSTRFRSHLYTHLVYANPRQHVAELYIQLARVFGAETFENLEQSMKVLRIDAKDEEEVDALTVQHQIAAGTPLLVINANAGDLCLERRWPMDRFGQVAQALSSHGQVLLVGAKQEHAYVDEVMRTVPADTGRPALNVAGNLSFGGFLALLRRSALVITNDTGPMHMAAGLGAPTVSLWGPGSPHHYEPRVARHRALWAGIFCSPCLYVTDVPPCYGNNVCMQSITVEAVLNAAAEVAPELGIPSREIPSHELLSHKKLLGVVYPERFARDAAPVQAKETL